MATLKDLLEKNKRSSTRWYDSMDQAKRKEMDALIKEFYAGKLPGHTTTTVAKTIVEYFKLGLHSKTICDYIREHSP